MRVGAECKLIALASDDVPDRDWIETFPASGSRTLASSRAMRQWLDKHTHEYDAVVAHSIWLNPTRYCVRAAAKSNTPVFVRPAGMLDPDALAHHRFRKMPRWIGGERRALQRAHLLFSSIEDQSRAMQHPDLAGLKSSVIPNAVSDEYFDIPHDPSDPPLILCLNRLHPRKGVLEFAKALAILWARGVVFTAIAAGPVQDRAYATEVRRIGSACGLDVRQNLNASDVQKLLARASLLVHPAVGYENFGMVIAESAAAGVPVVASPRALIAPPMARADALIASEPTPDALADAMQAALTDDGLAARGRAYAENFRLETVGGALLETLKGA